MPSAGGASLFYLTFEGHAVFLPGVFVLGAAVGYVAGMFGVGGGFLLTPLLTLVFGVPLPIAVGTGLCQVVATSLVSVLRFRDQRRGEQRFDLVMLGGSVMGTEAGTRALTALTEAGSVTLLGRRIAAVNLGVELSYVVIFLVVAIVFWRQGKSGTDRLAYVRRGPLARLPIPPFVDLQTVGLTRVSAPTIGYVGLVLGFVSGLIGIGGGVALMPILVYGFGFSMQHAAGTGVLMLVVSSSYGTFRHALAGHVSLPLAMTLLLGAPLAATLGSGLTTRLSAATMRRAFSLVVLGAVLAVAWDLARHLSPVTSPLPPLTMILPSIEHAVGTTPLVHLARTSARAGAEILAKLESVNPAGSVKDRIARAMVHDAEERGLLRPGATIIEPTSGNTGIALAMIAAARGYRLVLTMPETMSRERVALLRAYGAEVVRTPGTLMRAAVEQAEILGETTPGAVLLRQFDNPQNPAIHEQTTAEEVLWDTGEKLDVFVAGIGTGGTITGIGRVLRRRTPGVRIVGVEPSAAAVLTGGPVVGHHALQGIGAGFVPRVLDRSLLDEVLTVTDDQAIDAARLVAREDGVLAGISAGAALAAAMRLAARPELGGKRFVVVFPDAGERYASTRLFA